VRAAEGFVRVHEMEKILGASGCGAGVGANSKARRGKYDAGYGQGWPELCTYSPYMTVYSVISLPKIPYMYALYKVLANPSYVSSLYMYRTFGDFPAKIL